MAKRQTLARMALQEEDPEFQMAPMIDVVFQLLIFFMCVTTLQTVRIEKMELAVASSSTKPEEALGTAIINLGWQAGDKPDTVNVNGDVIPFAALQERLNQLYAQNKEVRIMLRADHRVRYKHVREVMDTCARANIGKINFVTLQSDMKGPMSR